MQKSAKLIVTFFLAAIMINILAAPPAQTGLVLYDQPDAKSKIIATISAGQPIVPIYYQGDWIKVGDPNNGNVGWVGKKMLTTSGYPTLYLKTYTDKGKNGDAQGYQIVQYSSSETMDQKQIDSMLKNFQAQQAVMQKQMNQLLQQDFNQIWARPIIIPILQPVVLMPSQKPDQPKELKIKNSQIKPTSPLPSG